MSETFNFVLQYTYVDKAGIDKVGIDKVGIEELTNLKVVQSCKTTTTAAVAPGWVQPCKNSYR